MQTTLTVTTHGRLRRRLAARPDRRCGKRRYHRHHGHRDDHPDDRRRSSSPEEILIITGPGADSLTITTNATTRALKIVNAQCAISGISFDNCKGLPGDVDTGGAIAVDNFTAGRSSKVTTISDCVLHQQPIRLGRCGGYLQRWPRHESLHLLRQFLHRHRLRHQRRWRSAQPRSDRGLDDHQLHLLRQQPGRDRRPASPAAAPSTITDRCRQSRRRSPSSTARFVGNVDSRGRCWRHQGKLHRQLPARWAKLKNCLLVNNQAPLSELRNFAGDPSGPLTTSYASLGGNVTDEVGDQRGIHDRRQRYRQQRRRSPRSVRPSLALNGGSTRSHAITRGSPAQRTGLSSTRRHRPARRTTPCEGRRGRLRTHRAGALRSPSPSSPLAENGTLDFGSTPIRAPVVATVTITNTQTSAFTTGPLALGESSPPPAIRSPAFPTASFANGQSAKLRPHADGRRHRPLHRPHELHRQRFVHPGARHHRRWHREPARRSTSPVSSPTPSSTGASSISVPPPPIPAMPPTRRTPPATASRTCSNTPSGSTRRPPTHPQPVSTAALILPATSR